MVVLGFADGHVRTMARQETASSSTELRLRVLTVPDLSDTKEIWKS